VGGLDTGVVAANKWYALYVISSADGALSGALLALAGATPVMPAGYTNLRRVGWARTNGSSLIVSFQAVGDWVYWTDAAAFTQATPSGTIDFKNFGVPPSSSKMAVNAYLTGGTGGHVAVTIPGTSMPPYVFCSFNTIATNNPSPSYVEELALSPTQTLTLTLVTSIGYQLTTLGYYDPV